MNWSELGAVLSACTSILDELPRDGVAAWVAACHQRLGRCLGARDGSVVLAVRVVEMVGDPLRGFRPLHAYVVGASVAQRDLVDEVMRDPDAFVADPVLQRVMRDAGRHRVLHDIDPRTVPELRDSVDARVWAERRLVDRIKAVHPLDERVELHCQLNRFEGEPPFTRDDEQVLEAANRALRPWVRRVAFLHGHTPGSTPLTARERDALCLLLTDDLQKNLGVRLGASGARARELVRDVYKKLGVSSRSELMARWLAEDRSVDAARVAESHARRR